MNRVLPNKISSFCMIFGCVTIGFFTFNGIFVYELADESTIKTIQIPTKDLVLIVISLFIVIGVMIFNQAIYPYFEEKKRKEYPIDNRGELV